MGAVERFLPDGWLVQAVAGALVLVIVTIFFAVDGRLPWWLGLLLTIGIAGGSAAAGWFASRVEPPEEGQKGEGVLACRTSGFVLAPATRARPRRARRRACA